MTDSSIYADAESAVLCWLATASADGQPNVSPKQIFRFVGDELLIANIASPRSAKNIAANPEVCVSYIDVFRQKGWQLHGTAEVIGRGHAEFAHLSQPLIELAGDRFPFASLFRIRVSKSKPVLAPSYVFYPDEVSEESMIAGARRDYGVD